MKYDVIIAGVGGQGILSIATVMGRAALEIGLHLKQSEVHGMAQRGGAVQSHLRVADAPISSDLIVQGRADMILSMEPMEALRYLPWLSAEGWVVSSETPVVNVPNYPPAEKIHAAIMALPHHVLFDAAGVAKEHGSPRSVNMAMLGAASPFISAMPAALFEKAIHAQFARKGDDVVNANIAVFRAGRALAESRRGGPPR